MGHKPAIIFNLTVGCCADISKGSEGWFAGKEPEATVKVGGAVGDGATGNVEGEVIASGGDGLIHDQFTAVGKVAVAVKVDPADEPAAADHVNGHGSAVDAIGTTLDIDRRDAILIGAIAISVGAG